MYRHNVSPFSSLSSSQQPSALLHTTASTTSSLSSPALFARGGGGGGGGWDRSKSTKTSTTTVALNSAVIDDQETEATTPPTPPEEIFRRDYKPLPWIVSNISMDFDIRDGRTTVISEMTIAINPKRSDNEDNDEDMVLDGEESAIRLLSLSLDGRALIEKEDYYIEPDKLVVKGSSLRMKWKAVVVLAVCCLSRRRLFQRIILNFPVRISFFSASTMLCKLYIPQKQLFPLHSPTRISL